MPLYPSKLTIQSAVIFGFYLPADHQISRLASTPTSSVLFSMVADSVYELCAPILKDASLEEEDKTDKLEELLKKETEFQGTALENAVLDVLWRFREESKSSSTSDAAASPTVRHTVLRRPSPAPWQIPRGSTPSAASPASSYSVGPPPGFGVPFPAFARTKSSTASPFTSPRPSPRLAFSSPKIPHSPSLNAYEFPRETAPAAELYGDYGSDTVDWLVNDDAMSNASSSAVSHGYESNLNGAAAAFIQPQQAEMSPYDILRSVLGEGKSDGEIERALESNGFDLTATIMSLMGEQQGEQDPSAAILTEGEASILIGKSMSPGPNLPATPAGQQRSPVVCKFWLSTGTCLRADCRFSHDLSNHICKYWVMGNCLAGESCVFSHDPSHLINRLSVEDNGAFDSSPPLVNAQPNFQMQDYAAFPALQSLGSDQLVFGSPGQLNVHGFSSMYGAGSGISATTPPGTRGHHSLLADAAVSFRSNSRPGSRGNSGAVTPSVPPVDDTEAFPSLGAVGAKGSGKKHHGKRGGHGHGHKENRDSGPSSSSLADVVRMSPSPAPGSLRKSLKANRSYTGSRENNIAAQAIPPPQHLPWLETGERANKAYMKARQDAIKHGGLRNKFLQSAAQAWNRNDARAAKALSLRGQSENDLMRKAHREAAHQLYEERNKDLTRNGELYVDLHGLHPEEAVEYLERVLLEQQASSNPVYIITGTGHHSKNGKDKVGKAVRAFLNDWRYAYREFSAPGDRSNVGGILGVDARSNSNSSSSSNGNGSGSSGFDKTLSSTITSSSVSAAAKTGPNATAAAAAAPVTLQSAISLTGGQENHRSTPSADSSITTTTTQTDSSAGASPVPIKVRPLRAGAGGGAGGGAAAAAASHAIPPAAAAAATAAAATATAVSASAKKGTAGLV
ncbi:MAG: hypothetical protein M1825_002948 [Sarcosagium campestre]|nr:MAG: hypothetical protein M1825_002948 [Sarcosagium campestre]